MTQRAQELFLAYAHFCGERGVEPLIPIVRQAVMDAMRDVELTAKLSADQVLQILSEAHMSESTALHLWSEPNTLSCEKAVRCLHPHA